MIVRQRSHHPLPNEADPSAEHDGKDDKDDWESMYYPLSFNRRFADSSQRRKKNARASATVSRLLSLILTELVEKEEADSKNKEEQNKKSESLVIFVLDAHTDNCCREGGRAKYVAIHRSSSDRAPY
jgi:hypothetical protein